MCGRLARKVLCLASVFVKICAGLKSEIQLKNPSSELRPELDLRPRESMWRSVSYRGLSAVARSLAAPAVRARPVAVQARGACSALPLRIPHRCLPKRRHARPPPSSPLCPLPRKHVCVSALCIAQLTLDVFLISPSAPPSSPPRFYAHSNEHHPCDVRHAGRRENRT